MADLGKLWFELGIKGDIGRDLEKYKAQFKSIDEVISNISTDFDKNANDILSSLNRISEARNALTKVFDKSTEAEKKKIEESIKTLDKLETHLIDILKDADKMNTKGLVSGFLSEETFAPIIQSINNYVRSLQKVINESEKILAQQERETKKIIASEEKALLKEAKEREKINIEIAKQISLQKELEATAHSDFKAAQNEAELAAATKKRTQELEKLKDAIIARDEAAARHGEFLQMQDAATGKEAQHERELARLKEYIIQKYKEEDEAIERANESQREFERQARSNTSTIKSYADSFERLSESTKSSSRYASEIKNQLSGLISIYAGERLLRNMIAIGGEFEKQHIALKSMLGDAERANDIFAQIKALAPISPFTFRDLSSYVKQLTAFNVPYTELYDTTKRLADISAGLGVDMSRLILAYGQVRSASVLRGQELRQFTEAGIPMVSALAEKLTEVNGKLVTTGEVFDYISKRKVPFEMVKEVLWDMTDAGGRFEDMQLTLSETLAGKWSNLQDAWEIMLSTMANSETIMGKFLKMGVQGVTDMVNALNKLTPMLAVGGAFAIFPSLWNKTKNVFTLQAASISDTIKKTKALQATQILMNVETEKQTWLQKEIVATKGKVNAIDIAILASEQKITALEAKMIMEANGIEKIEMERAVTEGIITKELYNQIGAATRLGAVVSKVGAFLKANAAMIALSAVGAALGYYWNESERATNQAEEAASNAEQRFQSLKKVVDSTFARNPQSTDEIKEEIKGIEEALKDVNPYLENFKEAHKTDDVKTYYEELRKELTLTADAYRIAAESKAFFEDLNKHSFDEQGVDTNLTQYINSVSETNTNLSKASATAIRKIKEAVREVAKENSEFRAALYDEEGNEKSITDVLRRLLNDPTGRNYHLINNTSQGVAKNILTDFVDHLDSEQDRLDDVREQLKPRLARIRNLILSTTEGISEGTEEYSSMFMQTLNRWVTSLGFNVEQVQGIWQGLLQQYGIIERYSNIIPLKPGESPITPNEGKSSNTDTILKQWKEEFNELKKFYSEYTKWAKDIGKDAALERLRKSGIFDSMFTKSGKPIYNIEDWQDSLKQFIQKIQGGSSERNKFKLDVELEDLKVEYDKNHEALEDAAKRLSESLSDEVAKYNLFEKIFEKTGDKEFAMSAFMKGRVWDDISRGMAQRLSEMLGKSVSEIDFDADSISMEKNLEGTKGAYELWKKIVEITEGNYVKSLEDAANATEKLMSYEDKIAKAREKVSELREKGASNAEIILAEREILKLQAERFENSIEYLKFYSATMSLPIAEAEKIGAAIKENLVKQLAEGTINADKFLKSMKNVDAQLEKIRSKKSDFWSFIDGGLNGLYQNKYNTEESKFSSAAIEMQKAKEAFDNALMKGDEAGMQQAASAANAAESMQEGAAAAMEGAQGAAQTVAVIDRVVHGINDTVQGIKGAFDEIRGMYDALGYDTESDTWEDWNTFLDGFSKASQSATNAWDSLKSGNIGGVIKGVVGSVTSWVTAIAQGHDRKLDNAIKKSVFEVNKLKTAYEDLEENISSRLGGIYGGNEYKNMLANLQKQRSELQKQMQLEDEKKKTDKQKMEDYKNSISDMDNQIKEFAADMAESLYSINVKSWAKELTDAVVDAWAKGEDAADAFHDKVRDIMQDLTTNILTQRVMEAALQPVFDEIINEMDKKSGKLDEESIDRFASALDARVEEAVPAITGILDRLKANGWDFSDKDSSSSSGLSKGIQGTSEETSNLLASYLNAVRADVSVIRSLIDSVYGSSETSIATSQLRQLEMITQNTERNAAAAERIESVLNSVTLGTKKIYIN